MEHTRRKEETPLWLNPNAHVWNTKNDIPVVNLRDVSEQLRLPRSTFRADGAPQTPDEESIQTESASSNSEKALEPIKQEPLNALFALIQNASEGRKTSLRVSHASSKIPHVAELTSITREAETRGPSFPEPKPAKAMDVEFVQGVNLPGENNAAAPLHEPAQRDTMPPVALFHDPVWGEVGSSYDVDSFMPKEEELSGVPSGLKLASIMESLRKSEGTTSDVTTGTAAMAAAPPPFGAPASMNDVMFQSPPPSTVVASPPTQIAYPHGINLGAAGWTTATAPHGHGMAVQPLQFVGVPLPFMPQNAMMALPQAYRMPYQFYQLHPQAPHLATVQHQPGIYHTSANMELHAMQTQKVVTTQKPSPRPGTNVGAAPFVPGGKGV